MIADPLADASLFLSFLGSAGSNFIEAAASSFNAQGREESFLEGYLDACMILW